MSSLTEDAKSTTKTDDGIEKKPNRAQRNRGGGLADEIKNPCIKENEMSMACMNEHNFDRDQCMIFFQNYRNCMDFWSRVSKDRRRAGIKPNLPPPSERDQIKHEYYMRATQGKQASGS